MHKNNTDLSHKTAITRRKPSSPMKWLDKHGLVFGMKDYTYITLDFGCGRGFDAVYYGLGSYDPYYYPIKLIPNYYDVIYCNYVLNVVPLIEEHKILMTIKKLLRKGGVAYISVRRDIKEEGFTSTGTYQRNVVLRYKLLVENSKFAIYEMQK